MWQACEERLCIGVCFLGPNPPRLNELKQQPFHLLLILRVGNLGWVQWSASGSWLVLPGVTRRAAVTWGLPGAAWPRRPHLPIGQLLLADGRTSLLTLSSTLKGASLGFLMWQHCVPKRKDKRQQGLWRLSLRSHMRSFPDILLVKEITRPAQIQRGGNRTDRPLWAYTQQWWGPLQLSAVCLRHCHLVLHAGPSMPRWRRQQPPGPDRWNSTNGGQSHCSQNPRRLCGSGQLVPEFSPGCIAPLESNVTIPNKVGDVPIPQPRISTSRTSHRCPQVSEDEHTHGSIV